MAKLITILNNMKKNLLILLMIFVSNIFSHCPNKSTVLIPMVLKFENRAFVSNKKYYSVKSFLETKTFNEFNEIKNIKDYPYLNEFIGDSFFVESNREFIIYKNLSYKNFSYFFCNESDVNITKQKIKNFKIDISFYFLDKRNLGVNLIYVLTNKSKDTYIVIWKYINNFRLKIFHKKNIKEKSR